MDSLTIAPALLVPTGEKRLTPAMVTALWVVGDELDRRRIPASHKDAVWLEIPSKRLRGTEGRNDNVWLRQCLERLTGLKINGEYRGDPWGAVVIAEWHIEQGGAVTRVLIPPAAVSALRAPETFAKIEAFAAYKLQGTARRLYAALADKKRLAQNYWTYGVDELREIAGVQDKKSYQRWNNFRQWVLEPAVEQINDYGTVKIKMTSHKVGRSVSTVRFDWNWKSIDEARETDEENDKPDVQRRKDQLAADAPPLSDVAAKPPHQIAINLRNTLEQAQWKSWFANCDFIEDEKGITVLAPSAFITDHIRQNFDQHIRQAADDYGLKGKVFIEKRLTA